ncbi:MAG: N-acetyl-gamma-glutamyl-phosphate reductase [Chloroflexota bacterium]
MTQAKVGILNVTGYIGMEVARLLRNHPNVKLTAVTGRGAAGQKLAAFLPHLADFDLTITEEPEAKVDILFSALPHKASAEVCSQALDKGIKVIDLSADFRLKDAREYEQWYGITHPTPHLLTEAVFGLTELHRSQIASARLVANPGCYPTAAILALAPLVREGLIQPDIIVDGKSGISGAGRTLSLATHYAEVNENASAYALDGHRHLPEIVNELKSLNPRLPIALTFLPHFVPMTRGILCSCYASLAPGKLRAKKAKEELMELYLHSYKDEPFVRVVDYSPQTKLTWGNNLCLIHPTFDPRTGRVVVLSSLDNLVKGGAGQAIQNMNLMLGFPEAQGLEAPAIFP